MQHLQKASHNPVGIARAVGGEAAPHFSHPCERASGLWRGTEEGPARRGTCRENELNGAGAHGLLAAWRVPRLGISAGLKSPLQPEPSHSLTQALLARFLAPLSGTANELQSDRAEYIIHRRSQTPSVRTFAV